MIKKANLSMNTIIVAIIALIVLIVLIVIFTGKAGIFRENTLKTCSAMGGECKTDTCPADKPLTIITRGCLPSSQGGGKSSDPESRGICCVNEKLI